MSDKHHEISTLTDNELLLELHQTAWLLESAGTLPAFGYVPNPEVLAAIKTRHAALEAEHARRSAPANATVGTLASRPYFPPARELTMTTPAKPKRVDVFLVGELEAAK